MVLDKVKQYVQDNLIDEDTMAILLIGSWAKGNYSDPFDIDMMIIKKFQLTEMYIDNVQTEEFHLDMYIYDQEALYIDLNGQQTDLNHMNNISLALLSLTSSEILFDRDNTITSKIEMAKTWSWDSSSSKYLDFNISAHSSDWIKNAVNEDLQLIEIAKNRFQEGAPITSRKKDYPSIVNSCDENTARLLMEKVSKAYDVSGISIRWSEFRDAERALATSDWKNAVASLKDVLRYLLRYALPSTPQQLMDPNLWISVENMKISIELEDALKLAFN